MGMEKSQWYIGTPNGVILCIDRMYQQQFTGRLYHAYRAETLEIASLEEMLFQLEEFFDSINFPHPTTNNRTFQGEAQTTTLREERVRVMSDEELLSKHGDLGTFIIRVQHRQNSSWQGRITWMDKDKTMYFRSMWEMLKLLASALDTVDGREENLEELNWPKDE